VTRASAGRPMSLFRGEQPAPWEGFWRLSARKGERRNVEHYGLDYNTGRVGPRFGRIGPAIGLGPDQEACDRMIPAVILCLLGVKAKRGFRPRALSDQACNRGETNLGFLSKNSAWMHVPPRFWGLFRDATENPLSSISAIILSKKKKPVILARLLRLSDAFAPSSLNGMVNTLQT